MTEQTKTEQTKTDQTKKSALKHIMINLGVLLILVGSTAVKGNYMFFFMGLLLLILQVVDSRVAQTKLVMAELILAGTLAIGALTQLVTAHTFSTPQAFLVVLLLGAILIIADSIREFVELE